MKKYLKNIMAGTMVFAMTAALAGCGGSGVRCVDRHQQDACLFSDTIHRARMRPLGVRSYVGDTRHDSRCVARVRHTIRFKGQS